MLILIEILSGVALILFGVRFLRKGLDRLLGPRLERLMRRLAAEPIRGFFAGLGVGLAVPSSTSVTALVIPPLKARQMSAFQMLPLVLGADIGITLLVLLASLRVEEAIGVLLVLGVPLYQYTTRTKSRGIGQAMVSLAFVFLGATTIKHAGTLVAGVPDLQSIFQIASHYPMTLMMAATMLAIALQSSTAAILLVTSFGSSGTLTLAVAIPALIGANLGISITRLAAGWYLPQARRLGYMNILPKLVVALAVWMLAVPIQTQVARLPLNFALQVAFLHTAFNIVTAMVGMATRPMLLQLCMNLAPEPETATPAAFGPRYINNKDAIDSPSLALGQSLREMLRASEIVREMLRDVWRALETSDEQLAKQVSERDDQVDLLDREIKKFLTRITGHDLDPETASEQMRQLRFISEVEAIGDIVDKNLSELVLKKIRNQMEFSKDGRADLQDFFQKVQENLLIAETAFQTRDRKLAAQLMRHKEWLSNYQRQLADRHLARLTAGLRESQETSAVHLDILANLKRINSCLSHVAYAILAGEPSTDRPATAAGREVSAATDPFGKIKTA